MRNYKMAGAKKYLAELIYGQTYILRNVGIFRQNMPKAVDENTAKRLGDVADYLSVKGGDRIKRYKFAIDEMKSESEAIAVEQEVEVENKKAEDATKDENIIDVIRAHSTRLRPVSNDEVGVTVQRAKSNRSSQSSSKKQEAESAKNPEAVVDPSATTEGGFKE